MYCETTSPDSGAETYTNPIIWSDYSDPDVIRVGEDYYLVASSFNCVPGLPILQSRDLVNWKILTYAMPLLYPVSYYSTPRHGGGIWAPAIRYNGGKWFIYYGDPDFGIYVLKADRPEGPWKGPILVKEAKGWIDPCPFWDGNGRAYLVHAYAKSRAGFNSILSLEYMVPEGTMLLGAGDTLFDGHETQPTIEGPKLYKRNGWYYVFAPAGGVSTGWQTVLRSRSIRGPYEAKIVMRQGSTPVNGPHQGAWIETPSGESWFIHFQDVGTGGRIIHLQPMIWKNDWPVIGNDPDSDGIGEPVRSWKRPVTGLRSTDFRLAEDDEFDSAPLGLQWQWEANPRTGWYSLTDAPGFLRLNIVPVPAGYRNLHDVPNLLLQKIPAPGFSAATCISTHFVNDGERAGIVVMGMDYAVLTLENYGKTYIVSQKTCTGPDSGEVEVENEKVTIAQSTVYLRLDYLTGDLCRFSYSPDGTEFKPIGTVFNAKKGKWTGAKIGLFCSGMKQSNGYILADWWKMVKIE